LPDNGIGVFDVVPDNLVLSTVLFGIQDMQTVHAQHPWHTLGFFTEAYGGYGYIALVVFKEAFATKGFQVRDYTPKERSLACGILLIVLYKKFDVLLLTMLFESSVVSGHAFFF